MSRPRLSRFHDVCEVLFHPPPSDADFGCNSLGGLVVASPGLVEQDIRRVLMVE